MKVDVYNAAKEKAGNVEVPDVMFLTSWRPDLVHQVVVAQAANARLPWAHAKTRGEVRGGGKKPWRQKGTGRARHGSIRSPLWIGGGVTFGPLKHRSFAQDINKKMRRTAMLSALSKKYAEGQVIVVESIGDKEIAKTKSLFEAIRALFSDNISATFIFSNAHKNAIKAARNIPGVAYLAPTSLNARDIMRSRDIIIEQEALQDIINEYKLA